MIEIRQATINDAARLSTFLTQLDCESEYLLYNPDERRIDTHSTKQYLTKICNSDKSAVFLALNNDGAIAAFIAGETPPFQRTSHTMKLVVGALKSHRGTGVGRMLSHALLEHAKKMRIIRLEAGVIIQNKLSLNLCKRMGMQIEGIKRHAMKIMDKYHDEYMLSLILHE